VAHSGEQEAHSVLYALSATYIGTEHRLNKVEAQPTKSTHGQQPQPVDSLPPISEFFRTVDVLQCIHQFQQGESFGKGWPVSV
jgi:hypothetical protein